MGFWEDLFDVNKWQRSLNAAATDPNPANAAGNLYGPSSQTGNLGQQFDSGKPVTDVLSGLGFLPKQVDPNAPGGHLDTSNADEERARMGTLLTQLQQQAATGGGGWEKTLKDATGKAGATAMALGQSMPGQGYQSQLQNIGNAQGAVNQRAVGQGNMLREQSKLGAQDQLSALLGGMGGQDAGEAVDASAAQQGVRDLQSSLNRQASKNFEGATGAIGNAFSGGMSDGGPVPGTPRVFGDDEANDTVPAMLSPGEIVIPRSHAGSPESAADFVRALHRSRGWAGVQHLDEGGTAGDGSGLAPTDMSGPNAGRDVALSVFLPHIGQRLTDQDRNGMQAPSIQNGGLLDTSKYDATRAANLQNANLLAGRAQGNGPSLAPQMLQNSTDANIAAALQTMSGARGPAASDVLGATAAAQQGAAGSAAARVAQEQAGGVDATSSALLAQRARDQALAAVSQQAAFKNTQMNAGLDLAQQEALRGLFAGTGQSFAAYSSAAGGHRGVGDRGSDINGTSLSFDQGFGSGGSSAGSSPSEWSNPYAHGGEVHAKTSATGRPGSAAPRRGGHVEVQPLEPTQMVTVHPPGFKPSQRDRPYASEDYDPNDYQLQLADGGKVPSFTVEDLFSTQPPAEQLAAAVAPAPESLQRPYAQSIPAPIDYSVPVPRGEDPELRKLLESPEKDLHPGARGIFERTSNRVEDDPESINYRRAADQAMADKAGAAQLGIRPKGTATPDVQTPGQPSPAPGPAVARGGSQGPLPGVTEEQRAVDEERAAIEKKGQLEAETARQTAAALAEGDKVLQQHELAQKELTARARATTEDLMRKHDAATSELRNMDTSVDPGRLWASKSTPGKITAILGLALGALGAGPDGVNRSAVMLNQAIDRDIDAQKAEHSIRLQKGRLAVDAAQSMYAMNHQLFQDDLAADAAAHASAWARVDNNLKRIIASGAGPQAQAAAAQLSALAGEKEAKFKSDAANIAFDNTTQRLLANATAAKGAGGGMGALSKEEQSKVYDVETATKNINDNLAKAKDIISRKGTFELTGTEQTELERALGDIAQDSARLKDPGSTVREAELSNAKKAIGVSGGEIFGLSNGTALKLLDSFGKGIDQRRKEALTVRGIRVP